MLRLLGSGSSEMFTHGKDRMYEELTKQGQLDRFSDQIAELRELFPFPEDKCYDNGHDWSKNDGWHLAEIVACPHMCLDAMIRVLKNSE